MTRSNHYTFGDTDLAAERLRLLAEAFAPSSQRLLSSLESPGSLVVELGSGPGYLTELIRDTLRPRLVIGLQRSPAFVTLARSRVEGAVRFLEQDVTAVPFPVPPADLVYARFLITHLRDPESALRAWAHAVRADGRLVLEETAAMQSEDAALQEYYGIVVRLQAHHEQRMYVGNELDSLCDADSWRIERSLFTPVEVEAPKMARLHALNIRTWRQDAFIAENYASSHIDRLTADLDAIVSCERTARPVRCTLKQMVLRRRRSSGREG
jgi:trans-aconitate 2-methyltransferase